MIESFGDRATEDLFHGRWTSRVRRFPPEILPSVLRKLDMLCAARSLGELRAFPGTRPKRLKGRGLGLNSIRIDRQWRLIFRWQKGAAREVRLVDYH